MLSKCTCTLFCFLEQRGDHSYGDENIDPAEEVLTVEAAFSPLLQDTMSKTKEPSFLVNMLPCSSPPKAQFSECNLRRKIHKLCKIPKSI